MCNVAVGLRRNKGVLQCCIWGRLPRVQCRSGIAAKQRSLTLLYLRQVSICAMSQRDCGETNKPEWYLRQVATCAMSQCDCGETKQPVLSNRCDFLWSETHDRSAACGNAASRNFLSFRLQLRVNLCCRLIAPNLTSEWFPSQKFQRNQGRRTISRKKCFKSGTDVMIFKNIFDETFSETIGVFCSNYC
jgi:hypothetical protein